MAQRYEASLDDTILVPDSRSEQIQTLKNNITNLTNQLNVIGNQLSALIDKVKTVEGDVNILINAKMQELQAQQTQVPIRK